MRLKKRLYVEDMARTDTPPTTRAMSIIGPISSSSNCGVRLPLAAEIGAGDFPLSVDRSLFLENMDHMQEKVEQKNEGYA